MPEEVISDSSVNIKEEGTVSVVVFDKKQLGSAVAKASAKDYKGDPIVITNLDKITFVPKGDFKPGTSDSISFSLSGSAQFEWLFDELALKQALVGQPRSSIPTILQKFPMIEKADISIRPFWMRKLPATLDKITIKKVS